MSQRRKLNSMGQLSAHKTSNAFQIWKSASLDMLRAYDGQFKTIYLHRLASVLNKLADKQVTSAFTALKEYSQDQHHKHLSSVKLQQGLVGLQQAMDQRTRVYLMRKVINLRNNFSF
jgi:hypothetical protein